MVDQFFFFLIYGIDLQWFLLFAVWVVYKFQKFIWTSPGSVENGEIYGEEYKTLDEARYKTQKKIRAEYPESGDLATTSFHDHREEGRYWAIQLLTSICTLVFVPVRKD